MGAVNGEATSWSLARRIGFRWLFSYASLYMMLMPFTEVKGMKWLEEAYTDAWGAIASWVATHILQIERAISTAETGSGDTTFHYVQLFCSVVFATIATIVWSALDRRRPNYTALYRALRIYMRYSLGLVMVIYGLVKVLKTQFPFPPVDWLVQPLGDSSPMRLIWAFMGYSTPYNLFTGGIETLGGLLLLHRRTTTLGALMLIGAMANVVVLNFSYDIPVKLFSLHLLAIAVILAAHDARRLVAVLILNRPTEPVDMRPSLPYEWMSRARPPVKAVFLLWTLGSLGYYAHDGYMQYGPGAPRHELAGLYKVERFARDGAVQPPLMTDSSRWHMLTVNRWGGTKIRMTDDSTTPARIKYDAAASTLTLTTPGKSGKPEEAVFSLSRPDDGHMELRGNFQNSEIEVLLAIRDPDDFLLVQRGFRWINEFPYNR